jgi:hypothetical protein
MLLDPNLRALYTNQGLLLKTLSCDRNVVEKDLSPKADGPDHTCSHCAKTIYSTVALSDDEVAALLDRDPDACLLVRRNQWNIKLISENPSPNS